MPEMILTENDRLKIKRLIDAAIQAYTEAKALRGGVADAVKGLAEELQIDVKVLKKMVTLAVKENDKPGTLEAEEEAFDEAKLLIRGAGHND